MKHFDVMKEKKEFWITNVSNIIVNLYDLNLFIKPHTSVNLMDRKHHTITEKQIQVSATSGALFKKRDKVLIRNISPEQETKIININKSPDLPFRERSTITVQEEFYEELELSQEEIADKNSDLELGNDD